MAFQVPKASRCEGASLPGESVLLNEIMFPSSDSKMLISSTYTIKIISEKCINIEVSKLKTFHSLNIKKFLNRKYQSLDNCLSS